MYPEAHGRVSRCCRCCHYRQTKSAWRPVPRNRRPSSSLLSGGKTARRSRCASPLPPSHATKVSMRALVIHIIGAYQRCLSPDHSWVSRFFPHGFCRFYPTCSSYAQDALKKYGIVQGSMCTARRLISCHPWNKGGIDHP